ncbi:hypothetical protein O181_083520 [Austropuccinia psidii MF-1]|uniref:Phosphoglycerate mutase-like protein n=1 Tax=Austropuccinia psidii MF-1 TaxID=1389203 RepID=A0A9Q3ILQ2_9BASI|nr:hypothetical protein [Austropuccinia psidii MF-1]
MQPKIIHLIRHGQAEHNLHCDNYRFPDAILTPTGRQQCLELNEKTQDTIQESAELLVSSPLRRTLQTTLLGLPRLINRLGGPSSIAVVPQLQENGPTPADTGSSKEELEKIKEFRGIDFRGLVDGWNSKTGFWASDHQSLRIRAAWIRRWLCDRPETEIVIVSHGGALRYLIEDYNPHNAWGNTECRTYSFTLIVEDGRLVPTFKHLSTLPLNRK